MKRGGLRMGRGAYWSDICMVYIVSSMEGLVIATSVEEGFESVYWIFGWSEYVAIN
jgi:hypothetical protein